MSPRAGEGPGALRTYGPLAGVVAALVAIGLVASLGSGPQSGSSAAGGAAAEQPASAAIPLTFEQARAEGREGSVDWGDDCDPATGRLRIPSMYAPPCLEVQPEGNGGASGPGVDSESITVVAYVAPRSGDFLNTFASSLDDPAAVEATAQAYVDMFNTVVRTYGRRVELVRFDATGAGDDAVAAQADAIEVVERLRPFAVLGGPDRTSAFAEELVQRGIVCIACAGVVPDQFYQDHAPYVWGLQATPDQLLVNLGDLITRRLMGRPATFAGDDDLRGRTRSFGVVHLEADPPVFGELGERSALCGAERGYETAATETYSLDLARMPERATTIIARMKEAGVTTIVFLGDPIMPIHLTQQATAQDYHPEWIVTGTALTDTTVLGRMYDQDQWSHAFGISSLPARTLREQGDAWRLHEWFHGSPPVAANTHGLIYAPIQLLFAGIHMAGPDLRAETFAEGLFALPESGGSPTAPHVSFGDHGYFKLPSEKDGECTSDDPRPDYQGTDDVTEIWWDADAVGPDEQGRSSRPGMWRYANGGRRYLPGEMTGEEVAAFVEEGSVTIVEEDPARDEIPDYPPPDG